MHTWVWDELASTSPATLSTTVGEPCFLPTEVRSCSPLLPTGSLRRKNVARCSPSMKCCQGYPGAGCCQTHITAGLDSIQVGFSTSWNFSGLGSSYLNACSYAFLVDDWFKISASNLSITETTRVPVVLDWAIKDGGTCEEARSSGNATIYACRSNNSECHSSTNGPQGIYQLFHGEIPTSPMDANVYSSLT